jgi:hypothetical protein
VNTTARGRSPEGSPELTVRAENGGRKKKVAKLKLPLQILPSLRRVGGGLASASVAEAASSQPHSGRRGIEFADPLDHGFQERTPILTRRGFQQGARAS